MMLIELKYSLRTHRLDAPTSGVVLFALSRNSARELSRMFAEKLMKKTYHAVVRGFVESQGVIELPLEIDAGPSTNSSPGVRPPILKRASKISTKK